MSSVVPPNLGQHQYREEEHEEEQKEGFRSTIEANQLDNGAQLDIEENNFISKKKVCVFKRRLIGGIP